MTSNLISQAGSTDRPYWLSNDVINIIDPLFLIVFIPLFDYIIYPWFAKRGTPIGLISRITLGFFLASLSMAWACYVQNLIYTSEPGSINVFMQIPAYCLIAASESKKEPEIGDNTKKKFDKANSLCSLFSLCIHRFPRIRIHTRPKVNDRYDQRILSAASCRRFCYWISSFPPLSRPVSDMELRGLCSSIFCYLSTVLVGV